MAIELGALLGQYDGSQSFTQVGSWNFTSSFEINTTNTHSSDTAFLRTAGSGEGYFLTYDYYTSNDLFERWNPDFGNHKIVGYAWVYMNNPQNSGEIDISFNGTLKHNTGSSLDYERYRFESEVNSTNQQCDIRFAFTNASSIDTDFYLDDILVSVDVIELRTAWDFENNQVNNVFYNETIGGKLSSYKWSDNQTWEVPLEFVCGSEANTINKWWRKGLNLMFTDDSSNSDRNYVVRITNPTEPLTRLNEPYYDQFNGTLILEAISNELQF